MDCSERRRAHRVSECQRMQAEVMLLFLVLLLTVCVIIDEMQDAGRRGEQGEGQRPARSALERMGDNDEGNS